MNHTKIGWTAAAALFAFSLTAAPAVAKGGSGGAKAKAPTVKVASAKPVKAKAPGGSTMASAKPKASTPKVKTASVSGGPKAKGNASASATTRTAKGGNTLTATDNVKKESGPNTLTAAKKESGPNTLTAAKKETDPPTLSAKKETDPPTLSANGPVDPQDNDPRPGDTRPVPPTLPLNKAQQLLMKNDNLRMKMQTRLGGLDPVAAASGFRNLGQFVAAVNVSSNNAGAFSFKELKNLMTGPTPISLGQALQQLRGLDPAVAATTANTAQAQADTDILATSRRTKGKS